MLVLKVVPLIVFFSLLCYAKETWLRPGCHKVGNTRKISIPDCVEFLITTNACRGFCESYSVPSMPWGNAGGSFRPPKPVVSVGQCCNMMESREVGVQCSARCEQRSDNISNILFVYFRCKSEFFVWMVGAMLPFSRLFLVVVIIAKRINFLRK